MRAIVDSAPDAPAAIAGLTTHAVNQQVRAGIAEAAVRKLEKDVAKLDAALLCARSKLLSMLSDPVQATGTGTAMGAGFGSSVLVVQQLELEALDRDLDVRQDTNFKVTDSFHIRQVAVAVEVEVQNLGLRLTLAAAHCARPPEICPH